MKTTQRILAPILILTALLIASPALAKPLVKCGLSLDRTILPAGLSQKTVIKVNLDVPVIPIEVSRPPVNLTLVLDRSGSMSGNKIVKAREAAITALRRLGLAAPPATHHRREMRDQLAGGIRFRKRRRHPRQ